MILLYCEGFVTYYFILDAIGFCSQRAYLKFITEVVAMFNKYMMRGKTFDIAGIQLDTILLIVNTNFLTCNY